MLDSVFPERPPAPVARPIPVVRVVRREPLAAIREILGVSIDQVVNERSCKALVADFYRLTRRIENEAWLRRELAAARTRDWIAANL